MTYVTSTYVLMAGAIHMIPSNHREAWRCSATRDPERRARNNWSATQMTAHPPRPLPAYNPSQPVLPAKFKCALQSRAHETLQVWPLPALPALSPLLPHRTSSLPRPTGLSMLVPWTQALPIPWSVYEFTYEDLGQMAPLRISPFRDECPRLPSLMHCSLLSCPSCVFMCTCPPPLRPHATVAMCYSFQNVHVC